jgi:hypothetical protein
VGALKSAFRMSLKGPLNSRCGGALGFDYGHGNLKKKMESCTCLFCFRHCFSHASHLSLVLHALRTTEILACPNYRAPQLAARDFVDGTHPCPSSIIDSTYPYL